ncbi:LAMI_0G10792g1_1 [Lachancea mirantina]|uniref:LAMI_0G10792g1_1 n=1 Tax=Lachancea mirantina TaxID=1230905 RepID=A0A1G4KAR4_9SACH|nr:LAMI_0G10792g1_1 [Lachancea mirantina]
MKATGIQNFASTSPGGNRIKFGLVGFTVGLIAASLFAIKVVERQRRELDWSDSVLELTRSIRKLEKHVKHLEDNQSSQKHSGSRSEN